MCYLSTVYKASVPYPLCFLSNQSLILPFICHLVHVDLGQDVTEERNLLNKMGDAIFTQQAGEGPHQKLPWQIEEKDC